ncbi:MAG TPA: radical SAM protein [Melioribacteraceae bacterium]|nr:radical SAM protein [Melioribacteraceae bacterium]
MNKLKVLLVANQRTLLGFNRWAKVPNLGLSSIAANLNKDICEVKIIDLVIAKNPDIIFNEILTTFKPDIVGFSSMIFQEAVVFKYAKVVKEYNKSIITVLGGYHPTVTYDEFYDRDGSENFDLIMRGEGEIAFNQLVEAIYYKKGLSDVKNITYKNGDEIIHNPQADLIDLSTLKLPDRKSRILKDDFHMLGYKADVAETSRGCTYDCNFCSIRLMYSKSFRKFSVERIIADLKDAKENGAEAVFLVDDNITLDSKRFAEICKAIIKEKLNLKIGLQASVKGLSNNKELLYLMKEAGVFVVFLGIENNTQTGLEFLHKDNQLKVDLTEQVVKELRDLDIIVVGGLIIGLPDDNEKSLIETYNYALKIGITLPIFFTLTPYPKTVLRQELLEQGLITNLYDYNKYNCWEVNVKTKHLSSEEFAKIKNKLEYKYVFESGNIWYFIKRYPKYLAKMIIEQIRLYPKVSVKFLTAKFFK